MVDKCRKTGMGLALSGAMEIKPGIKGNTAAHHLAFEPGIESDRLRCCRIG